VWLHHTTLQPVFMFQCNRYIKHCTILVNCL